MPWLYLSIAIVSEVVATSALKATEGFRHFWPSVVVVAGYGAAFYFLSLTQSAIPIGVSYAVWSGVGVALISAVGWVVYRQTLGLGELLGIGLIVAGVIVLKLFSTDEG
ncbi:MAG TPA: multidrug efflux SMR transporter [Methylocystis sp.]|nr:multidrug efflux SMR transporter [Methylocystis sp.]